MPRMDEKFGTGRERSSMCDTGEFLRPQTIADELRQEGSHRLNFRTTPEGTDQPTPITYPPAGNAGMDNDNDADDYNWAAYQQGPTTSSSGPP